MDRRVWCCGLVVSVLVFLGLLAGVVEARSPEQGERPNIPLHFQVVDPEAIPRGTCATLFWETPIEQDWPVFLNGEPVEPMGGIRVCPEETTLYHLLAETPDGPVERTVALAVVDTGGEIPPGEMPGLEAESGVLLIEFVADPPFISPGSCSHLHWQVEPAHLEMLLNGQQVDAGGERKVCPDASQTYELIVQGPDGLQEKHVTVQVEEIEPPPLVVPTIASESGVAPTQAAAGLSADMRPSDLYADNQPQGVMWGRITNDGHGTLTEQKVLVSGTGTVTPRSGGSAAPLSFAAKEYTLNIAPGQTETINLGWPVDTSLYSYQFTMQVQAVDFTDPNGSNNSYSEAVAPTGAAAPGPVTPQQPQQTLPAPPPSQPPAPGGLSVDVKPTDLYPDKRINGVMWTRITNRGPGTLSNNKVGVFGHVTETPLSGGNPAGKNLPEQEFTLNIAPGQEQQIKLGWPVDLSKSSYDFSVTVKMKDFSDPNPGNNTYSERFQGMLQAVPIPPPGPSFTQTVPGQNVDLLPEKITPGKAGTFNVTIRNKGPDIYHGNVQLVMSIVRTDKATGKQQSETRTELRNWLVPAHSILPDVDTGVYHDLSTYNYDFTVTITVLDAFDTNTGNNTRLVKIP